MKPTLLLTALLPALVLVAKDIEPTWESMAANYRCPEWFQDGKIGVWMHWGIPSAIDEARPNDGSHYGRRMYGDKEFKGTPNAQSEMTRILNEWHVKRYGPVDRFGYEKLILIKTLKAGGLLDREIDAIALLGSAEPITWKQNEAALSTQLPKMLPAQPVIGFRIVVK